MSLRCVTSAEDLRNAASCAEQPVVTLCKNHVPERHADGSECPHMAESGPSSFGLLGYLERVVHLNSKVADGALELAVAKQ